MQTGFPPAAVLITDKACAAVRTIGPSPRRRWHMSIRSLALIALLMAALPASAQKIKVGYDKSVDFSKFKSYSIAPPETTPSRPMLYLSIIGGIERELEAKGLTKRPAAESDLIVVPSGGMEFGINAEVGAPILSVPNAPVPSVNATMWSGTSGVPNAAAPYVPKGTLMLTFVDRATNQVVWEGLLSGKFDVEKKNKALQDIDKGITKLLQQFPPKAK